MKTGSEGFTLIELIVVIVLLGILSAIALPRFINVTTDARSAAARGFGGAVNSAAALAQAQWIAKGSTGTSVTTADGVVVAVSSGNGLPTGTSAGIGVMLRCDGTNCNGITADYTTPTAVTFTVDGAPTAANCRATYNANTGSVTVVSTCN